MMALAGSAWMVQYKARADEQPFEKYVADAAAAMRDEAFVLLKSGRDATPTGTRG